MENKRINLETKYRSKLSFDESASVSDVLASYYLPLIKTHAHSFYLALMADGKNSMINTVYVPIDRLVTMLDFSLETIENCISRLELVNLIEVMSDNNNRLIFLLKKPLTPVEFNNSEQFMELLISKAGRENVEINNKLFYSLRDQFVDGFKTTTTEIELNIDGNSSEAKLNISFNFDRVKNILNSKGIDWSSFWTDEFEAKLLDYIVIYKISSFDIAVEIFAQISKEGFNEEKIFASIKQNASKETNVDSLIEAGDNTKEIKLDYLSTLTVKDYFIFKLNREPSDLEMVMITKLKNKFGLNDNLINILIDYSVIVNKGKVNRNYITKIAETVIKEKMDEPEALVKYLKTAYKIKTNE